MSRAWVAVIPLVRPSLDPTQGREHMWILVDVTARDPEIVGRYQLGRLLGSGAFGAVRIAKNLSTGAHSLLQNRNAWVSSEAGFRWGRV